MNLNQRLTALENRPREIRGWRSFHTQGDGRYFENDMPKGAFDYHAAIVGMGGPDTEIPGAKAYSLADLQDMERDGWGVTIIEYQDMGGLWSAQGPQNAPEGLQDAPNEE